jgi:hypothetical protein
MDCHIGFRMRGPASVFTAIRMAMDHIQNESLDKGNGITKNLATYPSQIVGNLHEVAVK